MTTKQQDEIIREAMYLWPKNERFPIFQPDLYHWFARSNDHHQTDMGSGETMLEALLDAALTGQKISGGYEIVIKCIRHHLNSPVYSFEPTTESGL